VKDVQERRGSLVRLAWVNFLQYEGLGLRQTGYARPGMRLGANFERALPAAKGGVKNVEGDHRLHAGVDAGRSEPRPYRVKKRSYGTVECAFGLLRGARSRLR
jgi:hypothetical protein